MKPRKVVVTLEIETDLKLTALGGKPFWDHSIRDHLEAINYPHRTQVLQVQVNVVKDGPQYGPRSEDC